MGCTSMFVRDLSLGYIMKLSGSSDGFIPSYLHVQCTDCTAGYLPSKTAAARSKKALNSLICLRVPPPWLLLLAWSATRLTSNSRLARSAFFCSAGDSSAAACPFSTARSISCMAEESEMWR